MANPLRYLHLLQVYELRAGHRQPAFGSCPYALDSGIPITFGPLEIFAVIFLRIVREVGSINYPNDGVGSEYDIRGDESTRQR